MKGTRTVAVALVSMLVLIGPWMWFRSTSANDRVQQERLEEFAARNLADLRSDLGDDWSLATDTGRKTWVMSPPVSIPSQMRAIAQRRTDLDFVADSEDGPGLNGALDPSDIDAVVAALGADQIRLVNHTSVPPRELGLSLLELGAWVGCIAAGNVEPPPGMQGWDSEKGRETLLRIKATFAAWPIESRIGTMFARPPGFDPSTMGVSVLLEPLRAGASGAQAAIEARLGRSLEVVNGLPLVGYVSFKCQNPSGGDRYVLFYSLYDPETRGWIPAYLISMLPLSKQVEIGFDESKAYESELKFEALIPDGYISTSEGLIRE